MSSRPSPQIDRRVFTRRILGISLATLLGACAAPTATAPSPATPAAAAETLLLWHGWAGAPLQALGQLVDRFNRQSAAGRVILQSVPLAGLAADLRATALAGSGPHLAIMPNTWAGSLAAAGVLLDLGAEIPSADQAALIPAALGGASLATAGKAAQVVGLPLSFDTIALIYNGANILATPADTASLLASTRGLSAPTATPPIWGLAVNLSLDTMIGYLYAFGGRVFDEAGAVVLGSGGRGGAERWLAWVRALNTDQRLFARADSSIAVDHELRNGHALATLDWAHQVSVYRSLWGERASVATLPTLTETGQPARPYVRSDILIVNARAAGRERSAALDFVRFMASEESQLRLFQAGLQPARAIALPLSDPQSTAALAFRAQAMAGQPMPNGPERSMVDQELRLMLQQVLGGLSSPADAVDEADQRLRDRLSQQTVSKSSSKSAPTRLQNGYEM